jgi:hypothetical protein
MPTIDLQAIITTLTGHATSGGLIAGLGAAVATQAITSAATTALTNHSVLASLDPLGLFPSLHSAAVPVSATPVAPVAPTGPKTITLAQLSAIGMNADTAKALGYVVD